MPVPVHFADLRSRSTRTNTEAKIARLCDAAGLSAVVAKGDLVAIKVHFGEPGNHTFVAPWFARVVADKVREAGGRPFFADTNTLYKGGRSDAQAHLESAARHGFVPEVLGAPVLIADGLKGSDWRAVPVDGKWFKEAKVAGGFLDADAMVVVSHVKGHGMAGFGGAIKNIAMGCAPPAGKREQHCMKFEVRSAKCTACGACIEWCPTGALGREGGNPADRKAKALVDKAKCIGCGECLPRCAFDAIGMDWDADIPEFTEKMTEYALAALHGKKGKTLFLNFVTDVIPDCDCTPWSDAPVVGDQGILASTDPVAIDAASVDLVRAAPAARGSALEGKAGEGDDKFAALHPESRGALQLEHGERIGLGSRAYELKGL